jgi:hypothetical protein
VVSIERDRRGHGDVTGIRCSGLVPELTALIEIEASRIAGEPPRVPMRRGS